MHGQFGVHWETLTSKKVFVSRINLFYEQSPGNVKQFTTLESSRRPWIKKKHVIYPIMEFIYTDFVFVFFFSGNGTLGLCAELILLVAKTVL